MARKRSHGQKLKPGRTSTRRLTRGPNKGDTVKLKVAKGGNEFPLRIVKDVGKKNTSRVARSQRRRR